MFSSFSSLSSYSYAILLQLSILNFEWWAISDKNMALISDPWTQDMFLSDILLSICITTIMLFVIIVTRNRHITTQNYILILANQQLFKVITVAVYLNDVGYYQKLLQGLDAASASGSTNPYAEQLALFYRIHYHGANIYLITILLSIVCLFLYALLEIIVRNRRHRINASIHTFIPFSQYSVGKMESLRDSYR